jgi:hypothetical protein
MTHDCFTDPPKEAGYWNVDIKGIMACCAIYWLYDGEKWHTCSFLQGELSEGKARWFDGSRRDTY